MEKRKRYCCVCDAEIEEAILNEQHIPKRPVDVCLDCSIISYGYFEEEKDLVKEVRDLFLPNDYWRIEGILFVFRKFLKKKT